MKYSIFTITLFLSALNYGFSQSERWQQHVDYKMEIDMDVDKHRFTGSQNLVYTNNSPDTLYKVFYHLYFNAFQPESAMDIRLKNLPDPDGNMVINKGTDTDPIFIPRTSLLKPSEIGYHKIDKLQQNGKDVKFEINGSILEVTLNEPISPKSQVTFYMEFNSQVPLQIRRSGRDNAEGVSYSMTQWYPKLCEYDYQGWHADPYVGREFYGVWGNFDVKISIDKSFTLGGTGYLQNPNEIGKGYEDKGVTVEEQKGKKLTWHFVAPQVHDFAWAADPDFVHDVAQVPGGPTLHFIYQNNPELQANWKKAPEYIIKAFQYINEHYGKYPYKQFTIIQGGDGGMEYPMATLITGKRTFSSLVGVIVHEGLHNWYYGLLGSNEGLYPWMDEGFTSFASSYVMNNIFSMNKVNPSESSYDGYYHLANSGVEQPLSTHADHYNTSEAYWGAAYSKGATFLAQIEYIIGKEAFDKGMLRYFDEWKFKHPNPNDFIRVMEKVSGIELDWYREYFVNTTFTIDYNIFDVEGKGKKTQISLMRKGTMPMPVDVQIEYQNGDKELFNIPLDLMRGEKPQPNASVPYTVAADWMWVNKTYTLEIHRKKSEIKTVTIDPAHRMADIDITNNVYEVKD